MYLNDITILENQHKLFVGGLENNDQVQPASVDLRLGNEVLRCGPWNSEFLIHEQQPDGTWLFQPGVFYLAATIERVSIPVDMLARVDGRSSWGRAGLRVHATAGFIDPGFVGSITLEIDVIRPVSVPAGARICQISFARMIGAALTPYGEGRGSAYQDQPAGVPVTGRYGPHRKEKSST